MDKPRGFDTWNKALQGAYSKGYKAGFEGFPATTCPYADKRKDDGKLTWSRSFISAWRDGWAHGDDDRKKSHINQYYTDRNNSGFSPLHTMTFKR